MGKSLKLLRITFIFTFIFVFFLFFAKTSLALITEAGTSVVTGEEVVDDTIFVSGQVVKIESDVNGDIFCAGQSVEINSKVKGDVICAAQYLVINGVIDGNIRAVAQNLTINAQVTRNVTVAGQSIVSDAVVERDMFFGSQLARIGGDIKRNLIGGAENTFLSANIGNEVTLFTSTLNLEKGAKIKGNLIYESENEAVIAKDASVSGRIVRKTPPPERQPEKLVPKRIEKTPQNLLSSRFKSFVINLILVLVLVYFFKNFFQKITVAMVTNVKEFSLTGLMVLILTPAIAFLMMLTIIGIPFALAGLILYGFAIFFARLLGAVAVGVAATDKYFPAQKGSLLFAGGLGVLVSWIGLSIPVLRWFLAFFYIIWGLGAIYRHFRPITSKK